MNWFDLEKRINLIEEENLREKVRTFLTIYKEKFETFPASIKHHHNKTGGLLVHTIDVVDIATYISEKFPEINRDYLVASALLHDVGKINQYRKIRHGNIETWTYTNVNRYNGYKHEKWVVEEWEKVFKEPLPREIQMAILSHHGGWSKILYPEDILSSILHSADLISSRRGE